MKNCLLSLATVTCFLVLCLSCVDSDPGIITIYEYKNESSENILIDIYSPVLTNNGYAGGQKSSFEIPVDGQYSMKYFKLGTPVGVLLYLNGAPTGGDSLVISNGIKRIVDRSWDNGILYEKSNYSLSFPKDNIYHYRFVFTDDFFSEGEDI